MKKALIILPTYNEKDNIEKIVKLILKQEPFVSPIWSIEILIVDSHSPDQTSAVVKKLQKIYPEKIHLLETEKKGLGNAYYLGFNYALEKINPFIIFEMDADLSHNPNDIPRFLKEIEKGADFVIGSRYIKGGSIPKEWAWYRKIFSILGNIIVKFGFMIHSINDWTSGFRAIKSWVIKSSLSFVKNYSGYVFQIAILDWAYKKGAKIKETPINFIDRRFGRSKISFGHYIFQIIWYILNYSSFIKFLIVGTIGFLIDFGMFFIFVEKIKLPIWLSTSISAEIAIISNFVLNNFWSFSYKKITGSPLTYLLKFVKFNLISIGSIIIQAVGIELTAFFLGRSGVYLYKILIIAFLIIPYSYFMYNKIVWQKK